MEHKAAFSPQIQHPPALTKDEIKFLPLKRYDGPVVVVQDDARLRAVVPELRRERVLGFDIEVRPAFRSGDSFPPALVQLAGENAVCLVQLKRIGDLSPLGELFADDRVIKAGVAVAGDIAKLRELLPFKPARFVELGTMASKKGIKASGVRTLAANLLGIRISKGAQCSNWERADLTPAQVSYAATDAWICREIFNLLNKMPDIFPKGIKRTEQLIKK